MQSRRGFTLIELLVVVAIIALLIALLMPNLSKAKEITKRTRCLANLKAIGSAFYAYAGGNNDMVPDGGSVPFAWDPVKGLNASAGGNLLACSWPEELFADGTVRQRINDFNVNTGASTAGKSWYTGWAQNNGIFYCPNAATHNMPFAANVLPREPEKPGGYGMGYFAASIWYCSGGWGGFFDRATPIDKAGTVKPGNGQTYYPYTMKTAYWRPNDIVLAEGGTGRFTSGMGPAEQHPNSGRGGPGGCVYTRHMNGANYLLGDGHAEWSDIWHISHGDYGDPNWKTKWPQNELSDKEISRWSHYPMGRRGFNRP